MMLSNGWWMILFGLGSAAERVARRVAWAGSRMTISTVGNNALKPFFFFSARKTARRSFEAPSADKIVTLFRMRDNNSSSRAPGSPQRPSGVQNLLEESLLGRFTAATAWSFSKSAGGLFSHYHF